MPLATVTARDRHANEPSLASSSLDQKNVSSSSYQAMSPWKITLKINSGIISEIERKDGGFSVFCTPDVGQSAVAKLILRVISIRLFFFFGANHCINQSQWLHSVYVVWSVGVIIGCMNSKTSLP